MQLTYICGSLFRGISTPCLISSCSTVGCLSWKLNTGSCVCIYASLPIPNHDQRSLTSIQLLTREDLSRSSLFLSLFVSFLLSPPLPSPHLSSHLHSLTLCLFFSSALSFHGLWPIGKQVSGSEQGGQRKRGGSESVGGKQTLVLGGQWPVPRESISPSQHPTSSTVGPAEAVRTSESKHTYIQKRGSREKLRERKR